MRTSTVAIIPARGGSKRIPRKNLLELNGIPLLSYTIKAAIKSGVFDQIIVSSEDDEILELAEKEGVDIDRRPMSMAGDTVTKVQVVDEYIRRTSAIERHSHVAALLPTCPFRTAEDLEAAHALFFEAPTCESLVGVVKYDFPIQLALDLMEGDVVKMVDVDAYGTTRSQNIEPRYHPNGSIYMSSIKAFLEHKTFFRPEMKAYVMPAERSFDIDFPYQFAIAEAYVKYLNSQ